jgi:hypothetical protein
MPSGVWAKPKIENKIKQIDVRNNFIGIRFYPKIQKLCFVSGWFECFAATRRAGDSPPMLIKSTKVPFTTKLSLEHETPPFG